MSSFIPQPATGLNGLPIGAPTGAPMGQQPRRAPPPRPRKDASNPLRPPPKPRNRQVGPARSSIQKPLQPASFKSLPKKADADADANIQWSEFPLVTTKASLLKGLRHHVMKIHSNKTVNPNDPSEFTRPIRLHRRDPRAPPAGGKSDGMDRMEDDGIDPAEKAKLEAAQAAKDAEREATLAAIAPYGNSVKQKKNMFKKKTQQVYHQNDDERKLRYEENFPWHIEDFDNRNTWVGNLEGALSDGTYAMLVMKDASFQMVPIDKYYKFTQRNLFKTLSIDEAEAVLKKKNRPSRWFMEMTQKGDEDGVKKEEAAPASRMFLVKGERLKNAPKREFADADELDFDEIFQDDEEAPIMEGDEEENKEAEKRIKREYLTANIFDLKGEKEVEDEEREEKMIERSRKKGGRKVKKYLSRLEKNNTYESDSDENPYASSEEEDSTDDEALKEEEKKKKEEEEAKKKEEERKKLSPKKLDKKPGPSGRTESPAPSGPLDRKRPQLVPRSTGTPEPSGTDTTPNTPSGKSNLVKIRVNPQNLSSITSKPPSPSPPPPLKLAKRRKPGASGAGSDYDTGPEMSDGNEGGPSKKQKFNNISRPAGISPAGSRAGSPAVSGGRTPNASQGVPDKGPITEDEIRQLLMSMDRGEGVRMKDFTHVMKPRLLGDEAKKKQLIELIKKLAKTKNGILRLKPVAS